MSKPISWRMAKSTEADVARIIVAFRHTPKGRRVVYLSEFVPGSAFEAEHGPRALEFLKEGLDGFLVKGWRRLDHVMGSTLPEADLRLMAEAWLLDD
jgi:hypothetical protein